MKLEQTAPLEYRLAGSVGADLAASVQAEVAAVLRREDAEADQTDVFDLSGVVDGNSVMIALMMGWLRVAWRQDRQIAYRGVPATLVELIEFYGLDEVLPLVRDSEKEGRDTEKEVRGSEKEVRDSEKEVRDSEREGRDSDNEPGAQASVE